MGNHPAGPWILAGIAFAESSFFPLPPDVLLIPLALNRPSRAFQYAFLCTLASVSGGILGYIIGAYLFEWIGRPILDFYNATHAFELFRAKVALYDVWAVGIAGLTPIPYKIATIGAGALQLSLLRFIIASTLARGSRFFAVAALCFFIGEKAQAVIERRFEWITLSFAVALIAGYIIMKWIF